MDQRRLIERAQRGDHDAFAELVDHAVARLDRAARLILRDAELARDAVQEAFTVDVSPDGRFVLARYNSAGSLWSYDFGATEAVRVEATGPADFPSWQRLAP